MLYIRNTRCNVTKFTYVVFICLCIMLTVINISINRFVCLMGVDCVIYKDGN